MRLLDRRSNRRGGRSCGVLILILGSIVLMPVAVEAAKGPKADQQMKFGVEMARRGLWSEALFRFRQADRLEPNNPKTLNNLAVAFEAVGQFENALEYYKRALRAAPGNGDLKKNYARFIEFYQGFKPQGEEAGEEAAEETASSAENGDTGQA